MQQYRPYWHTKVPQYSFSGSILASHAGVFRGARFSSLPTNGMKMSSPKNAYVGGYYLMTRPVRKGWKKDRLAFVREITISVSYCC